MVFSNPHHTYAGYQQVRDKFEELEKKRAQRERKSKACGLLFDASRPLPKVLKSKAHWEARAQSKAPSKSHEQRRTQNDEGIRKKGDTSRKPQRTTETSAPVSVIIFESKTLHCTVASEIWEDPWI